MRRSLICKTRFSRVQSTNLTTISSPTQAYDSPPHRNTKTNLQAFRPAAFIIPGRKHTKLVPPLTNNLSKLKGLLGMGADLKTWPAHSFRRPQQLLWKALSQCEGLADLSTSQTQSGNNIFHHNQTSSWKKFTSAEVNWIL